MGYGFKVGGSLNFKATINVQANANVTVTLTLDGTQVASQTAGANGVVSFLVKKKGTYTVASSAASQNVEVTQNKGTYSANIFRATINAQANASATVTLSLNGTQVQTKTAGSDGKVAFTVSQVGTYTVASSIGSANVSVIVTKNSYSVNIFKATLTVQANASVKVTVTLDGSTIGSQTTGANGVASFTLTNTGTYTVSSPVRSANVSVTTNNASYSSNIVYVTPADNLAAGGYQTGSAYVVWNNESGYRTGSIVRYSTSTYPTTYNGGSSAFGTSSTAVAIAITNTNTKYGFRQSISSGQTLYWTRFNYVTVNGSTYYSAYNSSARATYTYASYAGKKVYTSGSGEWTVPTGVRSVVMFAAGGGGSGGTSYSYYSTYMYDGWGAGGGGGYTKTSSSIAVTPGMKASYSVGGGGASVSGENVDGKAGGTSTASLNGTSISASGGKGGIAKPPIDNSIGGDGGSGGGVGGFNVSSIGQSATGGAGGTDGGNGSKNSANYGTGGTGQGTTTAFDGTTYSAGGAGGRYNNTSGTAGADGTGNGGQGSAGSGSSGKGGSGTVIFKY